MAADGLAFSYIQRQLAQVRADLGAMRENATRNAQVEMTYVSSGIGQHRVKTPLVFPVVFSSIPHFSYGSVVLKAPDLSIWHDPIGHAGITGWIRDTRGYYTGAAIWVSVEVNPLIPAPTVSAGACGPTYIAPVPDALSVEHHLTFSARAIKDARAGAAIPSTMPPRRSGLIQ